MTDKYTQLVSRGLGKDVAKRLGLPQPVVLRRHQPGAPLVTGPVLVSGDSAGADDLATTMLGWGLDVRRNALPKEKLGAIVLVLDAVQHPEDLSKPVLTAGASLRDLAPNGRVITISRTPQSAGNPASAAARQGIDGLLRSLAKELRAGATANGILLDEHLDEHLATTSPSALGALRFFLSGRSAYVDGQFLTVRSSLGSLPNDADKPLAGKVAVVTGAARGIGAAIARTLHRDGAKVVVVDIPAAGEHLAAVANEVRGTALQLDISREDAGHRIIEHAVERHGRLDIVVHNAGITRDRLLANMDEGRWKSVIAVNIAAQLRINEALLASGHFKDSPRIVSVASTSGIAGNRGQTNYGASKGGVIGMVRSTAALMEPFGGTINAVAPGFIETEMTAKMPFAIREAARRLNSLKQGGQPQDVAEAIAFLASDASGGISGEVLRVCGQQLVGA
ncbi:3-oxoacyl-ACP reductase [Paenarthrobacter aurescens]|uniref:3-oxoacyl-ACP reductase n=1 Tax=Paenarthrobacter aurescens TaxID=43663 RepID=A0A4Y3NCY6_PAEAU|nr:3-oxoacyl-ACP reductase [Paenarthrobacter aurescens]MDO6143589.1 3-oxoacyl-ACP reductase [Paenarthrobacter aurescens]MDO6147437.1 3-oxoacyl-ACP reductase [Paenarthrobacter aurescens]MDO6158681.1 3-oxoacyl-ACP reductase [Paenarthrobacter aurescens]MDO6162664.1 3-oxoacyl-ACP reductase [Paenarthrobacter aurescens]GEB19804.1 3-oxoacyl-ACP reductase [Paenarthrobacter aurescens]